MATARFEAQPQAWQSVVFDAYQQATQAVMATMPAPPLPQGVKIQMAADQSNIGAEEMAAAHPSQPQQAAA